MTINVDVLRARVEKGVEWLDATMPDWRDRVVVQDLDMASSCQCVLGQVFDDVPSLIDWGGESGYEKVANGRVAVLNGEPYEFGFDASEGNWPLCWRDDAEYEALQEIWTEVLA